MSTIFGKLLTAMVTPFDKDNNIDWEKVKELANYLVNNGSDSIVVCGTTGESPTLSHDEKLEMFRIVVETVGGRAQVVAGTGSNNTADTVKLSLEAKNMGVDGIMLVVPYYNKPSQDALYQHFSHIAQKADLPILLYNVPSRTGINMLPDTVARLALLNNIVAVKEAAGDMDQVSELKVKLPENFAVYSGDDSITLPMLALGCQGVVSVASHLVGNDIKEMIDAFDQGDNFRANQIHSNLFPLFKALFITSNPVPLKAALKLKGINVGALRPPLIEATASELGVVKETMKKIGLLD
ncbi:4-hydroxy-tetrahydrodipicolinate synthase [Metallumcola ferriviriculae]|uniref:4-hydroxy-tetrahydrodipicolinate synthase n=1 Tax=Metallumcola ferriviriculae TaxID=3039180 RepID=A0AAU0UQ45_9FIRM|nr:4-hydroxy-tetrahydrodipicolinate synthase [Desulfitibacteraceae bacterium MK1]